MLNNNENKLVSVIVPIYNAEKTLRRCLDSIISQSYKNLEIILVNDGSSDNSIEICREYEQKDERIRVIDKVNQGVSAARNDGIAIAKGYYVAFVDSDDYIDKNMYEKLISASQNGEKDLIFCGYNIIENNNVIPLVEPNFSDVIVNKKFQYLLLPENNIMGVVWRSLFAKSLISDIKFDINIGIAEDLLFLVTALTKTDSIAVIEDKCYNYFSASSKYIDSKYINNHIKLAKEIETLLAEHNQQKLVRANYFYRYYTSWELWVYNDVNDKNFKKFIKNNADLSEFNSANNYKDFITFINSRKILVKAKLLHLKMYSLFRLFILINKKVFGNS